MDAVVLRYKSKLAGWPAAVPARTLGFSKKDLERRLKQMGPQMERMVPEAPASRSAPRVYRVAVIRSEGGQLVVEADAEVLMAGTPEKVVLVTHERGKRSKIKLTFDASLSTRLEGLQLGQRVMLVFHVDPKSSRELSGPVRLTWNTAGGVVHCDLELPATDESGNAPTTRPEE